MENGNLQPVFTFEHMQSHQNKVILFNKGDAAQSAVCKVGGLGPPKLNNEGSLWPKAIKD